MAAGFCRAGAVVGLLMLSADARAAEAPALLTLLEGPATLIIGARAHLAATGARLPAGTLIETEADTALLRLEWPDGSALDLGPSTRVMLRPGAASGGKAPLFYLLRGWAKQTQPTAAAGQLGHAFDVAPFKGVLVSQVDDGRVVLFCEAGDAPLVARRSDSTAVLRAGQSAVVAGATAAQVTQRPASDWLKQLPRSFRETLPSRTAQLAKLPSVPLQPGPVLTYARLQHWLSAEALLRRDMPARFAGLLADRGFKAAVESRLNQHPEWEPLLRSPRTGAAARKNNDTSVTEPTR